MKLNTLFVAAICAGTLLSSCVNKTAQERQLAYTQATLVDGDGFTAIQIIGEAVQTGVQYAERAEANGETAATQVKAYYDQLIPELDRVATMLQMDFPIKGIPAIDGGEVVATTADTDSTATVDAQIAREFDYTQHAQHEVAEIKKQLERLTRNTNKDIQDFAKNQLPLAIELYKEIGGKEEAHAHH